MRIELLSFDGCPTTPQTRSALMEAMSQMSGVEIAFSEIDLQSLAGDDARRGWPAPTILVNGRDLFGMEPPKTQALGCRLYQGGAPTAGAIADRLRDANRSDAIHPRRADSL